MSDLTLSIRQRRRNINRRLLEKIARRLLDQRLGNRAFEIGIHVVSARKMAEVNWRHLRHKGSTDVITFPYGEPDGVGALLGDIFICIDDALAQAAIFGTTWPSELVRYLVHGVLHLQGYDDLEPVARRIMKRVENRQLKALDQAIPFEDLELKKRAARTPRSNPTVTRPRRPAGTNRSPVR